MSGSRSGGEVVPGPDCESVVCDAGDHELVYDYTGDVDAEMRLSVSPSESGAELRCETTYTVPDSVFGRVAKPVIERFNEREMATFTENVRDMLESGADEQATTPQAD